MFTFKFVKTGRAGCLSLVAAFNPAQVNAGDMLTLAPLTVIESSDYYAQENSTASRTLSNTLETPYSLGMIDAPLLQDSQAMRLEDLAPFVSGVQPGSADSGFNTDVIIRGFSTGGSTYFNGLLDNQRFQVRDMALIERTEILKGHASVLYGAGNPGGVVNYIGKKPQATAHSLAQVSGGAGGGHAYLGRLVLDSTGPLNADKTLLYRVIAAGQLANEFRANVANDRATFAPSLTWNYRDGGSTTLELEYSQQNQPYRFDNVYTLHQVVYDQSYVDPRARSDRDNWRISWVLQQQLIDQWTLHLSSQYFHVERRDLLFGFYTFVTPGTLSGYYRDIHDHYDQFSSRGEIHGAFSYWGSQHSLIMGIEHNLSDARLNSQRNIGGFTLAVFQPAFGHEPPDTEALDRDTFTHELGLYATHKITLSPHWQVSGGVRYSAYDASVNQNTATDQHALSFNGGVVFSMTQNLASYFGFSQSFTPNSGVTRTQSFLPAKRGELLELGIKSHFFEQRLGFTTAVYQLTQSHLTMRDPLDSDYVIANGKVQSRGIEADLNGRVGERVELIANYSWIDSEFVRHDAWQGNALRSTPKHSGAVWGKYRLPMYDLPGQFRIGGGLVWAGRRYGDDANRFQVAGYARPDLFAHYQWENLDFNLKIENVLDKRYVSSSNFDDTVIQGNRLFVRATAQVSY